MRMGRVLGLVAAALVLAIGGLALAVYVTRDEGNIQADNLLSENFTRAVTLAEQDNHIVDLRRLARFEWDRVLLVAAGTPRAAISRRLGRPWKGIDTVDGGDLLIFLRAKDVVRFADYRGIARFEGVSRPFAELPPTLEVRSLVIRPRP
jgi:hypothetical protein